MGILPLEFVEGASAAGLGLTGHETFDLRGVEACLAGDPRRGLALEVVAHREDGSTIQFPVRVRIDTPQEVLYYRHGGILQYVLRQLAAS
jgi:aconitate hydratase